MKHRLSDEPYQPPAKFRRLHGSTSVEPLSCVDNLLDLCAKVVAEHLPFEYVEKTLVHIPEPVQEKIIYYSFPRCDSDIYTYASFLPKSEKRDKIPYYEGLEYFENGYVESVIQIGFHLTGSVKPLNDANTDLDKGKYEVSITFDRCKIISACCDCGNKGLSWCPHVVALALYRIRQPHKVDYRSPISDALVRMDRSQLQKFAQYLIASHPNKVLPSAQQLADELLQPESNINKMSGAPDPTAGASVEDVAAWYLDEAGVREQLRAELATLSGGGSTTVSGSSVHSVGTRPNVERSVNSVTGGSSTTGPAVSSTSSDLTNSFQSVESNQRSRIDNPGSTTREATTTDSLDRNPSIEAGLRWLYRYRQFTIHQNLLTSPTRDVGQLLPPEPITIPPGPNRCSPSAGTFSEWFVGHGLDDLFPGRCLFRPSCGHPGPGTHITAMFAKVRELLSKRDSNGPRLLSLITEELLRWPKLPLLKPRRNHRNSEFPSRMSLPNLSRPSLAYRLSSPGLAESPAAFHVLNNSPTTCAQVPSWTSRLWDEICLLWTCVVLNPDFTDDTRRGWRARFVSWARAHRCPRDDAYAVPSHYFSSVHDPNELDDEVYNQNFPNGSSGQPNRSARRSSVFQLPMEASFMSWDDEWLRHLLGFDTVKRIKITANTTHFPLPPEGVSSVDSDSPIEIPLRSPRRSSGASSRRSSAGSRPHSTGFTAPRECRCPYCDFTTPLTEPFPVLCLRVAALRSNGYFTQALRLGVFISQRLVRSFKYKVSHVANSLVHWNPSLLTSYHQPIYTPHLNQAYPNSNIDSSGRRPASTFPANSQNSRCVTPYYSSSRYTPTGHPLSSPPPLPHVKYPTLGGVSSPRPSSLSPPVSATIPSRPGSRRQVMSPSTCLSPAPASQPNWTSHQFGAPNQSPSLKANPFHFNGPPPPHHLHAHGYPSSTSPGSSHYHPIRYPNFFRSPVGPPTPYPSNPPVFTPNYGSVLGRSTAAPKPSGRSPPYYTPIRTATSSHGPPPPPPAAAAGGGGCDIPVDLFAMLSGSSSVACLTHAESGWLGLPGRPLLCLVECLLDAAAMVVESDYRCLADPIHHRFGQLEPAQFYFSLSVKIGMLALFQQRCLSGSATRLSASQSQEARLLALLGTMPRDSYTLSALCEPLLYLLGPPYLPRTTARQDQSMSSGPAWSPSTWSWTALGPLIHPDSYPVHTAARFVLDYILDAQKQTQLSQISNCWTSVGGHVSSIRIEELLFVVLARSMRFSVLETVSDHPGFPLVLSRSASAGTALNMGVSEPLGRGNRNSDTFAYGDSVRHLEVNTNFTDHPPSVLYPSFPPDQASQADNPAADYESFAFRFHPQSHPPHLPRSVPPSLDGERASVATASARYPPLPSMLFHSVQTCLRTADPAYTNSPTSPTALPVLTLPTTPHVGHLAACRARNPVPPTHPADSVPLIQSIYHQYPNLRRCLEALEFQQTLLAVALARLSRSQLLRLDQTAQICDRHVHSAVTLLAISQQIFAEAVGLEWDLGTAQPSTGPVSSFKAHFGPNSSNSLYPFCSTSIGKTFAAGSSSSPNLLSSTSCLRERTSLLCTAFHLALLVVLRTLTRTVHWRRREMLAWAVSTALHVGPSACLHLVTHWATYVTPREAVNWLAPALLSVIVKSDSSPPVTHEPKATEKSIDSTCLCHPVSCTESTSICPDHSPLFGLTGPDVLTDSGSSPSCAPWYSLPPPNIAPRATHTNSIALAVHLLSSAVPYSASARDHICSAVRAMAMQAAAKDPINCSLPALTLSERNPGAFDAVYRLILNSAENGSLGPVQLFSLARYMDSRGWPWRAFPFALHATRLFTLSVMQDSHPVGNHVLWACSLAHRLGPGALHELLNHVIRNIQCPTLLTEILHRCRLTPCGMNGNTAVAGTGPILSCPFNATPMDLPDSNPNGRSSFHGGPVYHMGAASVNPTAVGGGGKLLSLDRPPLKNLLDAAVTAYITATHTRLSNISPRQYTEFVDFLARARDTFHLLRPDGPAQFCSLVECLRHTYRGKRKLVSLLADRFG